MIALVWRYEVRDEARAAFEATYAPTGAWARLFARGDGYRGTELFRSEDGSYLTLDIWRSRADFDAFLAANGDDHFPNGADRDAHPSPPRHCRSTHCAPNQSVVPGDFAVSDA